MFIEIDRIIGHQTQDCIVDPVFTTTTLNTDFIVSIKYNDSMRVKGGDYDGHPTAELHIDGYGSIYVLQHTASAMMEAAGAVGVELPEDKPIVTPQAKVKYSHRLSDGPRVINKADVMAAVARGWGQPHTEDTVMDATLAQSITDEVCKMLDG